MGKHVDKCLGTKAFRLERWWTDVSARLVPLIRHNPRFVRGIARFRWIRKSDRREARATMMTNGNRNVSPPSERRNRWHAEERIWLTGSFPRRPQLAQLIRLVTAYNDVLVHLHLPSATDSIESSSFSSKIEIEFDHRLKAIPLRLVGRIIFSSFESCETF